MDVKMCDRCGQIHIKAVAVEIAVKRLTIEGLEKSTLTYDLCKPCRDGLVDYLEEVAGVSRIEYVKYEK